MTSNNAGGPIGLDIGTSRIVAAHKVDQEYEYHAQLNAFVTIPRSNLTESVLKREGVPHSVQGNEIVVHGNEAERFADLLSVETRRPMIKGTLNPSEPDSGVVIRQIIGSLLGPARKDHKQVCFSVPAAPLGSPGTLTYHEATLRQILEELGYEVKSINEGMAVVYGELENSNFTGIGVSCGGGLCNVAMSYLSVPVLSFSIAKAGDYIDNSAASVTGELANRIRLMKEEGFQLNGHYTDKIHQVLGVYYDDVIQALVGGLREAFLNTRNIPRMNRPIPLVLSGGTTIPAGFRERFEKILMASDFPVHVSEIRLATSPLNSTAKGALIAALSDM